MSLKYEPASEPLRLNLVGEEPNASRTEPEGASGVACRAGPRGPEPPLQGNLAHKKGGAVSYERGTPEHKILCGSGGGCRVWGAGVQGVGFRM